MKKTIFAVTLLLVLGSCSSNPPSEVFKPVTDIFRTNLWISVFKQLFTGYPDFPVTRELVEDIPYASMRVKIGKGPAGLMILQEKNDETYSWVSKDAVLLQIKNGRIIRTSGLINDLTEYFFDNDLPFKYFIDKEMNQANSLQKRNFQYLKRLLKCPAKDAINCNREIVEGTSYLPVTTRMISFSNPEVRGLEVFVKTANMGKETINILDREYEVLLFKEIIYNRKIDWVTLNLFWVDEETGKVRKSIQQIAPNLPSIVIEVTKAPSE